MKKFLLLLLLLFTLIILYGKYIETKKITIKEETIYITNLPDEFSDFKIVQFSDLLIRNTSDINNLNNVKEHLSKLDTDIIIFNGDLLKKNHQLNEDELKKITTYLKEINCNLYKYAVYGDNDLENKEIYKKIMDESNFKLLDNKTIPLFYKNNIPLRIIGITNNTNLNELEYDKELNYFSTILITHKPDIIDTLDLKDINTVFGGHSLNGQIIIPFIGGIIKKNGAKKYIEHSYQKDDANIFINNGIGTEYTNIRLFNKPTINIYKLAKK